jgi:hypothetical protein
VQSGSKREVSNMDDLHLEEKLNHLKDTIVAWIKRNNLWYEGIRFNDYIGYFDDEPKEYPCVLVLGYDDLLYDPLNCLDDGQLYDEFGELVRSLGFHYENWDNCTAMFFPEEGTEYVDAYRDYVEWKWICSLIKPDYSDLYEEIFERIIKRPDDLYKLHHRKYEIFLDSVFRNNGYNTKLGPGTGDGGVDIRLYHKDAIGDVLTLVQAKKYSPENPINLEAVSALTAVVEDEKANRGLFVTTSRYLPSAHSFAERQSNRIKLATSNDVVEWAKTATSRIVRDKSQLVSDENIRDIISSIRTDGHDSRIVCTSYGYNCCLIEYCLVVKESNSAALLMELPEYKIPRDGQRGQVLPVLDLSITNNRTRNKIFRAQRKTSNLGRVSYWGKRRLYHQWDGLPQWFDTLD